MVKIRLSQVFPGVVFFLLLNHQIIAQVENPVQRAVQEIKKPAPVQEVDGNLVPLIWKAEIDDSIVSVPLQNIEFFGIQDYVVDGATRVREITISTEHLEAVMIEYHARYLVPEQRSGTIRQIKVGE